jgi:hypothetical protein
MHDIALHCIPYPTLPYPTSTSSPPPPSLHLHLHLQDPSLSRPKNRTERNGMVLEWDGEAMLRYTHGAEHEKLACTCTYMYMYVLIPYIQYIFSSHDKTSTWLLRKATHEYVRSHNLAGNAIFVMQRGAKQGLGTLCAHPYPLALYPVLVFFFGRSS